MLSPASYNFPRVLHLSLEETNKGLIIGLTVGIITAAVFVAIAGAFILKAKNAGALNKAKLKVSSAYQNPDERSV